MSDDNNSGWLAISLLVIFAILLILKLTIITNMSWWIVLLPVLIIVGIFVLALVILLLAIIIIVGLLIIFLPIIILGTLIYGLYIVMKE